MLDFTMDGEVQKHRKQLVANAAADQTVSMAQYRELARRFNYFLKQHDKRKGELSHYRTRCYELEGEPRAINPELYQAYQKIDRQQQRLNKLEAENIALRTPASPVHLQAQLRADPPTINSIHPRCRWVLPWKGRGQWSSAFDILVVPSPKLRPREALCLPLRRVEVQ